MINFDGSDVLTPSEFATLLKISKRTLWRLLSGGDVPEPIRFGGSVRWQKKVVEKWLEDGCPSSKAPKNVRIDSEET